MQRDDRVWIYSVDLQAVIALGRAVHIYQVADGTWRVDLQWDVPVTRKLRAAPLDRGELWSRIEQPARANRATQRVLARLVAERDSVGRTGETAESDQRRRVKAEIVVRQGQQAFRQSLLDAYGYRCAISGETATEVLEAAHITPYMGPKSNRVSNGLLLRGDLHTLFDLDLLAIDEQLRVNLSDSLRGTGYWAFNGKKIRAPKVASDGPVRAKLAARTKKLK